VVPRLDELAAVTRVYARYAKIAFGFANVVAGLWLAGAAVVRRASLEWGAKHVFWSRLERRVAALRSPAP
jgi:hypothetical protein